jgi:limonene-1,2-epoxide hydrolase
MKARIFGLLLILVTLASLHVPAAQAGVEPISAVNAFFAALDAGDHKAAVAAFTPDAVATLVRGETYRGPEGMAQLVELMEQPGRYHDIVQATMVGNSVTVVVAVYDRGVRWGEETLVFEVQGGKLHSLHEQAFQVRFG